jgi:hypothetical protein
MAVKQMVRHAADNPYLHKDFHGALNFALIYLEKHFGEQGVREYLTRFADQFYAPLNQAIREKGLDALQSYMEKIYAIEGGQVEIRRLADPDSLEIHVASCPAVAHIRSKGQDMSPLYHLTHEIVNECICRDTPYQSELSGYEPQTGACVQRFTRRS